MLRTLSFTALVLAGCTTRGSVGEPWDLDTHSSFVTFNTGKADLLFMIDNSPSMEAMQTELRSRFGSLVSRISGVDGAAGALDLHIGVVTSDYGAGAIAGAGCTRSPGGDLGRLQARGAAADPSCQAPLGAPFIEYQVDASGTVSSNLPDGQTLESTFTCMASVGASGCGFEHQLESVYAALHDDAVTTGFLRDDAALTIVFVSNEDDGSAPPDSEIYSPTADPSLYGEYDTFRQTRFALVCGSPPAPLPYGPTFNLYNCAPAPVTEPLRQPFDVKRYIDFLTLPGALGGLKENPQSLAMVGITGPASPVRLRLANQGTGLGLPPNPTYESCGPELSDSCLVRLEHACQNQVQPAFFADPAVRLDTVINSAALHQTTSICGNFADQAPDYSMAMSNIGDLMLSQLTSGCLYEPLASPTHPDCTVTLDGKPVSACPEHLEPEPLSPTDCWHIVSDDRCPALRNPGSDVSSRLRLAVTNSGPRADVHASCKVF